MSLREQLEGSSVSASPAPAWDELTYRSTTTVCGALSGPPFTIYARYRLEISGREELTGQMQSHPSLAELAPLIEHLNHFPLVRLSEIWEHPNPLSTLPSARNPYYMLVGKWFKHPWRVAYVITAAPQDPFSNQEDWEPDLQMILIYDKGATERSTEWSVAVEVQSLIVEQVGDTGNSPEWVDGRPPLIIPIARASPMSIPQFTADRVFHVVKMSYLSLTSGMLHAILLQLSDLYAQFEINWELTLSRPSPVYRDFAAAMHEVDVLGCVVDHLDLQSLQHLSATNKRFHKLLRSSPTSRVRRALKPYFPGALEDLSTCMRRSGAIISGSVPLSIIQPGPWASKDLDFVVSKRTLHLVVDFLKEQGYIEEPPRPRVQLADEAIAPLPIQVAIPLDEEYPNNRRIRFDLKRFSKRTTRILQIDLSIIDTSIPGVTPANFILTYHSTPVMNLLTADAIYVFFPSLTFGHKLVINNMHRNSRSVSKYITRGYVPVVSTLPTLENPRPPIQTIREYLERKGLNRQEQRSAASLLDQVWVQQISLENGASVALSQVPEVDELASGSASGGSMSESNDAFQSSIDISIGSESPAVELVETILPGRSDDGIDVIVASDLESLNL